MIQAILRVEGNPFFSSKLVLRSGQSATVGRTDWADFCIETDRQLSDFEFELNCETARCKLTSCNLLSPVLVNGKAVISVNLRDGDTIQAGTTTFCVEVPNQDLDLGKPDDSNSEALQLESWLANIDLSDRAWELADGAKDPMTLVQELRKNELFTDAIGVLAHMLSKQDSVEWAATCVREVNSDLDESDQKALAAAEEWANEPCESSRRAAAIAAHDETEHFSLSASRWLAMSAYWSDGDIATKDGRVIVPDNGLTNQAIKIGLIKAAVEIDPSDSEERLDNFISRGLSQVSRNAEHTCTV